MENLIPQKHPLRDIKRRMDAADEKAERRTGLKMLRRTRQRPDLSPRTVGADKRYDNGEFLQEVEERLGMQAHVAVRAEQPKRVDNLESLTRSQVSQRSSTPGYVASWRIRMRIEEIMGGG